MAALWTHPVAMDQSMKARRRMTSQRFGAPWGARVKIASGAAFGLLLAMAIILPFSLPRQAFPAGWIGPGALALVLAAVTPFCVRGFAIRHRELWIQRLFWQTRLSLAELQAARVDPQAMKKCIRTAGNGGFLVFTGWFWSKRHGRFRAYVTDPERCVVLEFRNRKVVVSPDDPKGFVAALGFDPAEHGREN